MLTFADAPEHSSPFFYQPVPFPMTKSNTFLLIAVIFFPSFTVYIFLKCLQCFVAYDRWRARHAVDPLDRTRLLQLVLIVGVGPKCFSQPYCIQS